MKFFRKSSLPSLFALMLFSFSIIGFLGCESEDVFENSRAEFLELDSYMFSEMSEHDMYKVGQAIERMDVRMKDGLYHIRYTSGAQVNISEELFGLIKSGFDHTNSILSPSNSKRLKFSVLRLKRTSTEGSQQTQTDCMGRAISRLAGKPLNEVNSYLESTYGTDGVPLESFGAACKHFLPNGTVGTADILAYGGSNTDAIVIFITNFDNAHAVNVIHYDQTHGTIWYRDDQNQTQGVISVGQVVKAFKK